MKEVLSNSFASTWKDIINKRRYFGRAVNAMVIQKLYGLSSMRLQHLDKV